MSDRATDERRAALHAHIKRCDGALIALWVVMPLLWVAYLLIDRYCR